MSERAVESRRVPVLEKEGGSQGEKAAYRERIPDV